jgi:hypothetical protein
MESPRLEQIQLTNGGVFTVEFNKNIMEILYTNRDLAKEKEITIKLSSIETITYERTEGTYNVAIYTTNMMHYITDGFSSRDKCLQVYDVLTELWMTYLSWK